MNRSSGAQGALLSITAGGTIFLTLFLPDLFSNASQEQISIVSPLLSAVAVFIGDWLIARCGVESARVMRVKKSVQCQIDTLHNNIERHQSNNLPTDDLEVELKRAVIAQSKQEEAFRKGLSKS